MRFLLQFIDWRFDFWMSNENVKEQARLRLAVLVSKKVSTTAFFFRRSAYFTYSQQQTESAFVDYTTKKGRKVKTEGVEEYSRIPTPSLLPRSELLAIRVNCTNIVCVVSF